MAFLLYMAGEKKGQEIELVEGSNTVGRRDDCKVHLDDPSVSAFHCVITIEPDSVIIEDKGSTNGTRINNKKLTAARLLFSGDVIKFGKLPMMIDGDDVPERGEKGVVVDKPRINLKLRKAGVDAPMTRPKDFAKRSNTKMIWLVCLSIGVLLVLGALAFFLRETVFSK